MSRQPLNPRLAVGAALTSLAFALAACSGDTPGSAAGSGDELTWEDSPINEFFAPLDSFTEMTEEEMQQQAVKAEEEIAKCMQEQGFEYIAYTGNMGFGIGTDTEDLPAEEQHGTKEFAEKYGFGMLSWPEYNESDLNDDEFEEDPNWAIQEQLSDSEREAYEIALYGDYATSTQDDGIEITESLDNGCQGKAYNSIGGIDFTELAQNPTYQSITEKLDLLYSEDTLSQNSRYIEASNAYYSCMADRGFPEVTEDNDAWTAFDTMYMEFTEEVEPDWENMTEEEMMNFDYPDITQLPGYADLQQKEIDLAVADFECNEKSNREQVSLQVQFEQEQQFVDENRAELETLQALLEDMQKNQ